MRLDQILDSENAATAGAPAASVFDGIEYVRLNRDGTATIRFANGAERTAHLGQPVFDVSSAIAQTTHLPHSSHLRIETTRGDHILLDIPRPDDLTPIGGRSTIYLDQNHWSTLAKAIHEPRRIINEDERDAALRLIDLGISRRIILPMSSGHMAETCKWTDNDRRYHLALTFAQLGAGWQLRDPLDVRRFELRQAFITTYQNYRLLPPPTIMLEPDAMHGHIPRRAAARTDL